MSSLKSFVHKHHLENNITFLGRVDNKHIPKLLQQSDIFIRLSRQEGFGMSLIEAMASGLPVITTPVGGIVDFVKQRKTGILVKPDDPREAMEAFKTLKNDRALYDSLSKNGQVLVNKEYSWERISNDIEEAFNQLT